jgi:hypothetical protein
MLLTMLSTTFACAIPVCCSGSEEMRGSVSSFAYQGTNSHVVLGAAGSLALKAPQPWLWQRSRLWYQVTSHPLLLRFSLSRGALPPRPAGGVAGGEARVQCSLRRPALSYLADHSVAGQAVAPNALLLEMASAAGQLLRSQERLDNPVAVAATAFQQPLLLLPAGASEALVTCSISAASGAVAVSSRAAPTSQAAPVHMQAQLLVMRPAGPAGKPAAAGTTDDEAAKEAASPPAAPRFSPRVTAALLSGSIGAATGSASAAFAAVLTEQQQHTGYWVHPAVADASLQLAAALQAPAGASSAEMLVSAAVGAYAPMRQLAAGGATAGAAAGLGGRNSSHWLGGATGQLLEIIDNQFKTLAALRSLAAAAEAAGAAAAQHLPFLPSALGASTAGMLPSLTLLAPGAASLAPAVSVEAVVRQLSEVVAGLLGRSDIPTDQPLMEAGLDSIGKLGRQGVHACIAALGAFVTARCCNSAPIVLIACPHLLCSALCCPAPDCLPPCPLLQALSSLRMQSAPSLESSCLPPSHLTIQPSKPWAATLPNSSRAQQAHSAKAKGRTWRPSASLCWPP